MCDQFYVALAFIGINDSKHELWRVTFVLEFLLLLPPLLPHDNTDPSITLPNGTITQFDDGTEYSYHSPDGDTDSKTIFSNCHFTAGRYNTNARPLFFSHYTGSITLLSCSFTDIVGTDDFGGAYNRTYFTARLCNFTNCSSDDNGGALSLFLADDSLVDSCRFERCSTHRGDSSYSYAGAVYLQGYCNTDHAPGKLLRFVGCVIIDCMADTDGGGVYAQGKMGMSFVNMKFERCQLLGGVYHASGAGIGYHLMAGSVTAEGSHFFECSSTLAGAAIGVLFLNNLTVSDSLVESCHSGTTGAIYAEQTRDHTTLSLSHVYFVGNSVGEGTSSLGSMNTEENEGKFTDIALLKIDRNYMPTLQFNNCFTANIHDSSGMIMDRVWNGTGYSDPERHLDPEFEKIGPILTAGCRKLHPTHNQGSSTC
ncbi:hypothetical protein BLNAU_5050 [Blattamonas nauphoetae]|uniref:Right handed beta helix domain-containing protein n=1 Tax=Blattamonas nauphoetae TaxID=2049346 RepID=A0ABQ9Y7Y5_9EUKA|nr:hypothetical protein BLNAU_5050 [Blattamonas nauphoetae]